MKRSASASSPMDVEYLKTGVGYVLSQPNASHVTVLDWPMQRNPVSPLTPFLHLLTARTSADGVAAMRTQPDPALNVLFADDAAMSRTISPAAFRSNRVGDGGSATATHPLRRTCATTMHRTSTRRAPQSL